MNNAIKISNSGYLKRYQVEKGSVETITDLPTEGNTDNDVYYVKAEDVNYIWNGSSWEINEGDITIDINAVVTSITITGSDLVVTKGDGSTINIPLPGASYDLDGGTP